MTDRKSSPASLTLVDPKSNVKDSWELNEEKTYYIGRGKNNDICLPVSWISRQHAMIQVETNGVHNLIDLGSSNGTMVNGRRQHSAVRLRSGDKIQIGSEKTTLVFFDNYIPPANKEIAEEKEEETIALLQTEEVTILVCDIRNFTSLSEKIGAQSVSNILAVWSKKVAELVTLYNGSIDKFIGDAVMAVWSDKENQKENIHQALKTVAAINSLTSKISDRLPQLPRPLTVGGAINTGEVVRGNIGVDGGRDYTVVGDAVNVTFRLEELTTKIGVDLLLGANSTEFITADAAHFTPYKYMVKGKQEPVNALGCSFKELDKYLSTL